MVKSYYVKCVFLFLNISDSALVWFFLNYILTSSFTSQEVRTVGIFYCYWDMVTLVQKNIKKIGEIALLEKKFKLDFLNIYHSYILK